MTIVTYTHRPKRARKRAQSVAITGPRIVTAKKPKPMRFVAPSARAEKPDEATAPAATPPVERKSAIVTAPRKPGRFGNAPELSDEEHQRRGDAAEALFREIVRRATRNDGAQAP